MPYECVQLKRLVLCLSYAGRLDVHFWSTKMKFSYTRSILRNEEVYLFVRTKMYVSAAIELFV